MRNIPLAIVLPVLSLVLSACMSSRLDEEVVSSLQYDTVACPDLVSQRNALAARHGIAGTGKDLTPGERPAYLPTGAGMIVPDLRGGAARERARAVGEVAAMDRSIERRCAQS